MSYCSATQEKFAVWLVVEVRIAAAVEFFLLIFVPSGILLLFFILT